MGKLYMKLDLDWMDDDKFIEFEALNGHRYTGDAIKVFTVCRLCGGAIRTDNVAHMVKLRRKTDLGDDALSDLLHRMAQVGLIDQTAYTELGIIGSRRTMQEGEEAEKRKESARRNIAKRWVNGDSDTVGNTVGNTDGNTD